jgi:hypothetical protein
VDGQEGQGQGRASSRLLQARGTMRRRRSGRRLLLGVRDRGNDSNKVEDRRKARDSHKGRIKGRVKGRDSHKDRVTEWT